MNFLFSTAWALPCLLLLIALPVLWYVMTRFAMEPGLHQLMATGNQDFTPCGLADGEDNRPSQSTPVRPGPRDDPIHEDVPALNKSPDQICYEAYRGESQGYRPAWDCLPVSEQMAWKAAADAVIIHAVQCIERADDVTEAGRASMADFTTEAQRGTENEGSPSPPLPVSPSPDYCAGPEDPVIPPHHTGHADRVVG